MVTFDDGMNRRSFLRGSSFVAAALLAAPLTALAQQAEPQPKPDPSKNAPAEPQPDRGPTLKDEQGREYRVCPQCGYNMYKQENTWTCENCGYSYVE